MDEEQMPIKKKRKKRRKKKRKEIILTPRQRYEQAVALKDAVRCVFRVEDEYFIYSKLTEDFAALAELPEVFEGQEECRALSEECREKAEERRGLVSEHTEEDTRTVTRTVKQREAGGSSKGGKARWLAAVIAVLIICVIIAFQIEGSRYAIAFIEKGIGFKDESLEMFQSLKDYNDSEQQATQMEQILLRESHKGDVVAFGKMHWIVLAKKNGAVCLMKLEGEKKLLYHSQEENITWEKCDVRKFLNTEYFEKHFTASEKEIILTTDVPAVRNAAYPTDAGNDTKDKIFILSSKEVKKYKKAIMSEGQNRGNNMRLRTPGKEAITTEFVSGLGEVVEYGYPVNKPGALIHPVMWVYVNEN